MTEVQMLQLSPYAGLIVTDRGVSYAWNTFSTILFV